MTLRKATKKDVKQITTLFNSDSNLHSDDSTEGYIEEDVHSYLSSKINRLIVFEEDGKVVGAALAQFWESYVHLHLIVVDKNAQGKGIGKQLIDYLENLAIKENKDLIESFTETGNVKMQGLFDKLNYKKGKTFHAYSKELKRRK